MIVVLRTNFFQRRQVLAFGQAPTTLCLMIVGNVGQDVVVLDLDGFGFGIGMLRAWLRLTNPANKR